jgi:hypothetical protein
MSQGRKPPAVTDRPCGRCGGAGFVEVVRGDQEEGVETCPRCGGPPHPLHQVFRILDRQQQEIRNLEKQVTGLAAEVSEIKEVLLRGT